MCVIYVTNNFNFPPKKRKDSFANWCKISFSRGMWVCKEIKEVKRDWNCYNSMILQNNDRKSLNLKELQFKMSQYIGMINTI